MRLETVKNNLRPISTDESANISQEYFNAKYGFTEKPVLFSSAFKNWDIKEKWSLNLLKESLSDPELIAGIEQELPKKAMTLAQYLESGLTASYYYKSQRHLENPDLPTDYLPRSIFDCWYAGNSVSKPKRQLSWLYVGGAGTFSDTHKDMWGTSAWNYLIEGKKLWLIYPKSYVNLIKKNKADFSIRNLEKNLESKALSSSYTPLYCVQEPGQLIFVPNNCYHAAYNLSLTVAVTENFVNETNYDLVRSYFRGGTNRKNVSDIECIIKQGFEKIKSKTD